ncbi:MAG: glycosyltransferase family 39 protein [Thermoanaerobaculales bacterium]
MVARKEPVLSEAHENDWPLWRRPGFVLAGIVAVSTTFRVVFAGLVFGFRGGDDVEILEAAFRVAVHLPYQPWNIRNLLLPDLFVAPWAILGHALGITGVRALVFLGTLPFIISGSLNVILVYHLARRWLQSHTCGVVAATLYAFHWLPLAYSSMPFPRPPAVTCLLAGAIALSGPARESRRGFLAGLLLAVAFACRYSEVVFLPPLLLLAVQRPGPPANRVRAASGVLVGFIAGSLVTVGFFDWLTWGVPFSSLVAFAKLTLIEKSFASRVELQPPLWYAARLLVWAPATLLPLLPAAGGGKAPRSAWIFALLPVASLSLIAHKELRYLQGVIPFLCILAAAGAVALFNRGWRRTTTAIVGLTLALGVNNAVRLLAGNSMAAVQAAQAIAADPNARTVVLSQAWAYGDRLLLPASTKVRELGTLPSGTELATAIHGADAVCLYEEDVRGHPELGAALHAAGLRPTQRFSCAESRPVVVYR